MSEEWRAVPGFEGLYEVSDLGRVRSLDRVVSQINRWGSLTTYLRKGRTLTAYVNRERGFYRYVNLQKGGGQHMRRVARLVAAAFHGACPNGWQVCHLDGSRNNDAAENLKWGTAAENSSHKEAHGTQLRGEKHGASRLSEDQARRIKYGEESADHLGDVLGVHPGHVNNIRRGVRWSHV